jgi:(p)ppGpp synthase/HD superfamily hydrolase
MNKRDYDKWRLFCIERHDVYCNQKYAEQYPYSFHLEMVARNVLKYGDVLEEHMLDPMAFYNTREGLSYAALAVAYGHDLIEDARFTYNDVKQHVGYHIAEAIFSCTESSGRTREERHDHVFWNKLRCNEMGAFVKLCDIMANTEFSFSQGHSMMKKHHKEWPQIKKVELAMYQKVYKPLFDYLDEIHKQHAASLDKTNFASESASTAANI